MKKKTIFERFEESYVLEQADIVSRVDYLSPFDLHDSSGDPLANLCFWKPRYQAMCYVCDLVDSRYLDVVGRMAGGFGDGSEEEPVLYAKISLASGDSIELKSVGRDGFKILVLYNESTVGTVISNGAVSEHQISAVKRWDIFLAGATSAWGRVNPAKRETLRHLPLSLLNYQQELFINLCADDAFSSMVSCVTNMLAEMSGNESELQCQDFVLPQGVVALPASEEILLFAMSCFFRVMVFRQGIILDLTED